MKKMIPLLLILFVLKASAQDSTNKSPGIITKKIFGPYRMGGNRIPQREFKTEVFKVPAAIPFYKKAKTNEIIVFFSLLWQLGWVFLVIIITILQEILFIARGVSADIQLVWL